MSSSHTGSGQLYRRNETAQTQQCAQRRTPPPCQKQAESDARQVGAAQPAHDQTAQRRGKEQDGEPVDGGSPKHRAGGNAGDGVGAVNVDRERGWAPATPPARSGAPGTWRSSRQRSWPRPPRRARAGQTPAVCSAKKTPINERVPTPAAIAPAQGPRIQPTKPKTPWLIGKLLPDDSTTENGMNESVVTTAEGRRCTPPARRRLAALPWNWTVRSSRLVEKSLITHAKYLPSYITCGQPGINIHFMSGRGEVDGL